MVKKASKIEDTIIQPKNDKKIRVKYVRTEQNGYQIINGLSRVKI
jgi:hypothetical protein